MPQAVYIMPRRAGPRAWVPQITTIHFDPVECSFLLWRLRQVNAVVEALTHRIDPVLHRQRWERRQVVERTLQAIHALDSKGYVHIAGELMAAIITQAIEGNNYFWNLPEGDKRRCAKNIAKADACRLKIQSALKQPVRRFRL